VTAYIDKEEEESKMANH